MPAPDASTPDKLAKLIGPPPCPLLLGTRRDALRAEAPMSRSVTRAVPEAGMLLHDTFYRWCRDATGETHDWPTNRPGGAA